MKTWNIALLARATIRVQASYELGDEQLVRMQSEIDQKLSMEMAALADRIKRAYPDCETQYNVMY